MNSPLGTVQLIKLRYLTVQKQYCLSNAHMNAIYDKNTLHYDHQYCVGHTDIKMPSSLPA